MFGRGAVDELPGIACAAYGTKILKDRGWPAGLTVVLVASVMEEDCDGLPLMHLIETEGVRPDVVVLGEPTNLDVYRGHRGRMEIEVVTKGRSAHGAHCERGVNAIYKMAPIVKDIEALNARLAHDDFLGKGTVTVSFVDCKTPSFNAVPDECRDRARPPADHRRDPGARRSPRSAPCRSIGDAVVRVLPYDATSWRGLHAAQDKTYPTWVLPEPHSLVQGVAAAAEAVLGRRAGDLPLDVLDQRRGHGRAGSASPRWGSPRGARSCPTPRASGRDELGGSVAVRADAEGPRPSGAQSLISRPADAGATTPP